MDFRETSDRIVDSIRVEDSHSLNRTLSELLIEKSRLLEQPKSKSRDKKIGGILALLMIISIYNEDSVAIETHLQNLMNE